MTERGGTALALRTAALLMAALLPACASDSAKQVTASRTASIDTPHGRTVLILDIGSNESERVEMERLLADHTADVAVISAPAGTAWRRLRGLDRRRVHVTLIDACAGGRTADCTREIARRLESLREGPAWP